jgi:hypothetical protein
MFVFKSLNILKTYNVKTIVKKQEKKNEKKMKKNEKKKLNFIFFFWVSITIAF